MEIDQGYKQTQLVSIPEDWTVIELRERAIFKTGPFGSTLHKSDYIENGVPWINPIHIVDGRIAPDNRVTVSEEAANRLSDFRLRSKDIIIARRGDMGRCAVVQDSQSGWLCGSGSMIIRCTQQLDPEFAQRVIASPRAIADLENASVGSTMNNLNQGVLGRLEIQCPPTIAEQRAIAAALSDTDDLIAGLERLIAKKRGVKQAAMQGLLTGKTRLPGFAGEWKNSLFGDMALPRSERVDPRRGGTHDFCIELDNIEQGTGRLLGFTSTNQQSSLRSIFYERDVLFGKLRAYLRKYWLAKQNGVCSTEIWVLTAISSRLIPEYLYHLVTDDRFIDAASTAYGTHMPRSDWNVVKALELAVPSLPEQRAIAAVLSDMDAEIAALERQREKTRMLKQGMMQELLTGRTRLV